MEASKISYASEIQRMMFGFGDSHRPLIQTAEVIEDVVKTQITEILRRAIEVSAKFKASDEEGNDSYDSDVSTVKVGLEELLFLMRRNPVKVQRLVKYLHVKDLAAAAALSQTGNPETTTSITDGTSRVKKCRDLLAQVDTSSGLLLAAANEELADEARLERLRRLDRIAVDMDGARYVDFARARQASFIGHKMRNMQKFHEWVTSRFEQEVKIDKMGLEVFSFLAYETVGQIVELALMVQREQTGAGARGRRSARTAAAVNPTFPMVQLLAPTMVQLMAGEESPLRKRLKSGNANEVETATAGSCVVLELCPLEPGHVREAARRLTVVRAPLMAFRRIDAHHQKAEAAMHIIAI